MSKPRSLLLAEQTGRSWSTKNKNRFQCAAIEAYRAEMAEAEMRAARAVRDATMAMGDNAFHLMDEARLRAVIEKAREGK